jgi:hypothetical protein
MTIRHAPHLKRDAGVWIQPADLIASHTAKLVSPHVPSASGHLAMTFSTRAVMYPLISAVVRCCSRITSTSVSFVYLASTDFGSVAPRRASSTSDTVARTPSSPGTAAAADDEDVVVVGADEAVRATAGLVVSPFTVLKPLGDEDDLVDATRTLLLLASLSLPEDSFGGSGLDDAVAFSGCCCVLAADSGFVLAPWGSEFGFAAVAPCVGGGAAAAGVDCAVEAAVAPAFLLLGATARKLSGLRATCCPLARTIT